MGQVAERTKLASGGEHAACAGRVWDGWRWNGCGKRATVRVGAETFCGTHDPLAAARRRLKAAERGYQDNVGRARQFATEDFSRACVNAERAAYAVIAAARLRFRAGETDLQTFAVAAASAVDSAEPRRLEAEAERDRVVQNAERTYGAALAVARRNAEAAGVESTQGAESTAPESTG